MKFADLRDKSTSELTQLLEKSTQELRDLRFKASERQLKEVHKIQAAKRDVARIKTRLTQLANEQA